MINTKALIVFKRNPIYSKVKTRIAKESNDELALSIYQKLCQIVESNCKLQDTDLLHYYSDFVPIGHPTEYAFVQTGFDLGQRMHNAFSEVLKKYKSAVLIGTDCPYINKDDLDYSFQLLQLYDVVIGPALDGGYYLIGLNSPNLELFKDIDWSTEQVMLQTRNKLNKLRLSCYEMINYMDIDTLSDWKKYSGNSKK
ncbi:MAG: TIGR04282 family arsenosugar biosynthesis glycosyltransferase [Saprospiraceae bacterium]|nr:TIGR04282 family arsenosugar biosynthesis glycosyltransferase [Saprospiraceae bacterium]